MDILFAHVHQISNTMNAILTPFCFLERVAQFYKGAIDTSETLSLQDVKGSNIFIKDAIRERIYSFCCHVCW